MAKKKAFKLECLYVPKYRNKRYLVQVGGPQLTKFTNKDSGEFDINNSYTYLPAQQVDMANQPIPHTYEKIHISLHQLTDLDGKSVSEEIIAYVNARRAVNKDRVVACGSGGLSWEMLVHWELFLRSKNSHPVNSPKSNVALFLKYTSLNDGAHPERRTIEIDMENAEEQLSKFYNGSVVLEQIGNIVK